MFASSGFSLNCRRLAVAGLALLVASGAARAGDTRIAFDLPLAVECRDVTPEAFRASYPTMKVIEGTLRISARVVDGAESEIVDFLYVIDGSNGGMRFQDYLPNTTLESTVIDDQIEIKSGNESITGGGLDARVVYKPVTAGGTLSHSQKQSESSSYRRIAPKELVLASGTIHREQGVFFRLRPSLTASLEGAKEFTFLATVPITWRGDVCTIACDARARKKSLWGSSIDSAGSVRASVPLHLVGDAEAAELAREFRRAQRNYLAALAATQDDVLHTISNHTINLVMPKKVVTKSGKQLWQAEKAVSEVQQQLTRLAE